MQVFKLFFQIAKAKMPGGLIYLIVFFAVCFPLSKATAEKSSFTETQLRVVVFDEDQSAESRALVDHIGANHKLMDMENDPQKLLDAMYYERIDYTLTIKKGYGEQLAKTDADASAQALFETFHLHDSYATMMMEQYLDEYVRTVRSYVAGGNELSQAIEKTEAQIDVKADVDYVSFDNGTTTDPDYSENFAFVFRYMPYVFLSIFINVLCPVLLVMKKKDQRYRMNCSSIKQSSFSAQIFGGTGLLVFAVWVIIMIGTAVMYGGMFRGANCWIAVGNSLLFSMISAAIALLISAFCPSQNVINMIAQCVGLGMCFMCGVFVPQTLLGEGVLSAARFLPAYWYEKANDILAGTQAGTMGDVGICILIEAGFLVALALVTVLVSRQRPAGRRRKVKTVAQGAEL